MVRRLILSAAKWRSNAVETSGEELAEMIDPELFEGSLLMGALERAGVMEEVDFTTLMNILYLVDHKAPTLRMAYGLRWNDELPTMEELLASGAYTTSGGAV